MLAWSRAISIDVNLVLLLDAQSLQIGYSLSLQGGLHGLEGTLVVLPAVLELILLLLDPPVDLLPHLRHCKEAYMNIELWIKFNSKMSVAHAYNIVVENFKTHNHLEYRILMEVNINKNAKTIYNL